MEIYILSLESREGEEDGQLWLALAATGIGVALWQLSTATSASHGSVQCKI